MHYNPNDLRPLSVESLINGSCRRYQTLTATGIYLGIGGLTMEKLGTPVGGGTLHDLDRAAGVHEEEHPPLEAAAGGGEPPPPPNR
jgi:hypothetical protein